MGISAWCFSHPFSVLFCRWLYDFVIPFAMLLCCVFPSKAAILCVCVCCAHSNMSWNAKNISNVCSVFITMSFCRSGYFCTNKGWEQQRQRKKKGKPNAQHLLLLAMLTCRCAYSIFYCTFCTILRRTTHWSGRDCECCHSHGNFINIFVRRIVLLSLDF